MNELVPAETAELLPAAPPAASNGGMLAIIAAAAANPAVDPDKMQRLLDMHAQMRAEQARLEFQRAMSDAQAEMQPVVRDAENLHTRSRYARLETIDAAVRPIYTRHGFSLSFNTEPMEPPNVRVTCIAAHSGGHEARYTLEGALDAMGAKGVANKTPIQALGSTVTYLQRYLTKMIFNITLRNEDDDGISSRSGYRAPTAPEPPAPASEPSKARLTPEQWLDRFAADCAAAETEDELQDVLARKAVQDAHQRATGDHRARMQRIIDAAIARFNMPQDPR